VKEKNIEIIF